MEKRRSHSRSIKLMEDDKMKPEEDHHPEKVHSHEREHLFGSMNPDIIKDSEDE